MALKVCLLRQRLCLFLLNIFLSLLSGLLVIFGLFKKFYLYFTLISFTYILLIFYPCIFVNTLIPYICNIFFLK